MALVGHEPLLSELASYLLTGDEAHVRLEMKKGGVACLDCGAGQGAPEPGSATLYWLATPKMLRAMRECG